MSGWDGIMSEYKLEKVTITKFLKLLDKEYLALKEDQEDEKEGLNFSICRLEDEKRRYGAKAKLICIDELEEFRKKGWRIKEGFWEINGKAWYIGVKI